jgi:ABC-type multidrug transport system fused ATPase/permease subunit
LHVLGALMPAPNLAFTLELKNIIRLSWEMLTRAERLRVVILAAGMVIDGVLQTFSLALLIPFVGLMLDPTAMKSSRRLSQVDRLLGSPSPETLIMMCAVALLLAILFKNVFEYLYSRMQNRLIARVERRVTDELLTRCMRAPYVWHLSYNTSRLINVISSDVVLWARSGLRSILSLTSSAVLIVSILALLVSINPVFGAGLALCGAALGVGILALVKSKIRRLAQSKHEAHIEGTRILHDALGGLKDIKINGREDFFMRRYSAQRKVYSNTEADLTTLHHVPKYAIEITIALILVAVGIVVSVDISLRAQMAALLAVYGVAIVRMVPIFNQVSLTVNVMHTSVPAIWSIRRIQGELAELASQAVVVAPANPIGDWNRIQLQGVQYVYPRGGAAAIAGISFEIERGMRIGVVGRSGAGKTTLVDLLTGLLSPPHGSITIGDVELGPANAGTWRRQIGYVPQHPFLVDESLRFNVALESDRNLIDDNKITEALEVANLGGLLRHELKDGLDTKLGDRGNRLSGGQRQRVAIARALYRDPSLLIFDEATSSLDAESENEISLALGRISREKTLLIIAHRLSTVKDCDRILVLEKGAVIGFDTHENLIKTCLLYRRFVELGDLSPSAPNGDENAAAMVAAK